MVLSDCQRVAEIANPLFFDPWGEGIFQQCLAVGYEAYVLEAEQVDAFIIYQWIVDECHLYNLGVSLEQQRKGLGRSLMNYLLEEVGKRQVRRIFLEVRASNDSAKGLYEHFGFERVGVRTDYYPVEGGREDAHVYALEP